MIFEIDAETIDVAGPVLTQSAALVAIAAQVVVIGFLRIITKPRDIKSVRPPAVSGLVRMGFQGPSCPHAKVVIHHIPPQRAALIHAFRKSGGLGVHQNRRGGDRGGVEENDFGEKLGGLEREFIDQSDAHRLIAFVVEYHRVDDGMRPESHISGQFRRLESRRLAAEIGSERTSSHAMVPVETGRASERELLRGGSGQVRRSARNHFAAGPFSLDRLFQIQFRRRQRHRRLENAVRQDVETFHRPADACEFLDMVIPGSEFGVADRPRN